MTRREFPTKVRLAAWERACGRCEHCGIKIGAGNGPEYDHVVPAGFDGEPTLENCRCLCTPCHKLKTSGDIPRIAKAKRIDKARAGVTRRKAILPGSKASRFKRKIDGTVVPR